MGTGRPAYRSFGCFLVLSIVFRCATTRWPLVSLSQLGDTFLALLAGRTLQLTKMEHPLITLARLAEKAYIEGWTISLEEYAAKNGISLDALE